jgi:hypothetical protein
MAVSINGHNQEAIAGAVDKIKLVDMLENHSKIAQKLDSKQSQNKPTSWIEIIICYCVSITWYG